MLEKFKSATPVASDLCLRKTPTGKSHNHREAIVFEKLLKCFPYTLKRKASVFKFLRFEEPFRKAPFISNRRNKAAFSNLFDGPKLN